MKVLALNAGSRSHKAELFEVATSASLEPSQPLWDVSDESADGSFAALLAHYSGDEPDAVVHRFVHPGPELAQTIAFRIDERARHLIEKSDLAPSHNPLALEGLTSATSRFRKAAQIGISDVVLGSDAPDVATTYPVPFAWKERYGVRRYGFHGISHRDALERVSALCGADDARRTVSVHLGSGCSVVAARGRRVVDSSMGMTPFEGAMMGSRSGSVDPGMLLTLLRRGVMTSGDLEHALSKESGLRGVSGISADTRELDEAVRAGNRRAAFALELYTYILRKHIGAMTAALGGIDVLALTGPVGEHSPALRRTVCDQLQFLGIDVDDARNSALATEGPQASDTSIEAITSRIRVFVIRTLEEWAMARAAANLMNGTSP